MRKNNNRMIKRCISKHQNALLIHMRSAPIVSHKRPAASLSPPLKYMRFFSMVSRNELTLPESAESAPRAIITTQPRHPTKMPLLPHSGSPIAVVKLLTLLLERCFCMQDESASRFTPKPIYSYRTLSTTHHPPLAYDVVVLYAEGTLKQIFLHYTFEHW